MGRCIVAGLICALGLALPSLASAQVELRNDGFTSGDAASFQGGFVAGEMGASRLVPTGTGPFRVHKVRFLFGGDTLTKDITLRIYEDTGLASAPGTEVYQGGFSVTGSNSAMHEIDLTAQNVLVSGTFRVAIEFTHDGFPSIAADADGNIAATRNFLLHDTLGWIQSNLAGLTGDWIIRADVSDTSVGAADAGVPADASPGAPDASPGTPDAAPGAPDAAPGSTDAAVSGPDAAAGDTCALNSDCTNGSYCGDDGVCTFDCRVATDCPSGNSCDPVGRCVADTGGGDGGCGCRTDGRGGASSLGLILFGALLAIRRRRRR